MNNSDSTNLVKATNSDLTVINKQIKVYDALVIKSSKRIAKVYYKKAIKFHFKKKEYEKAREYYLKAIEINPVYENAYLKYGYLLSNAFRDYDSAIEIFSTVIKLNPKNELAYFKRGTCKSNLKDYAGNLEDYNEYMKLTVIDSGIFVSRAIIKSRLNDYSGEISDYTEAIKLNKSDNFAYTYRGIAKFKLKDYEEAISDFKQSIEIIIERNKVSNEKENFGIGNLKFYGKAKFELKEFNSAIKIFKKLIDQYPRHFFTYELIAFCYKELNDDKNYSFFIQKFTTLNEVHQQRIKNTEIKSSK